MTLFLSGVGHRSSAAASISIAALGLLAPTFAWAQYMPNETLVSSSRNLIDFEFSQSRNDIAWTDPAGHLWLGGVNPDTGAFEPENGKGQLLTDSSVHGINEFAWNGPEWLATSAGDEIMYSYYLAGEPPVAASTRMALLTQNSSGTWVNQPLGPANAARMFDVTSHNPGDPNPTIMYFDPQYNHYWRDVNNAATEQLLPFLPAVDKAWRFATGERAIPYTSQVSGTYQVFQYLLDSGVSEQLTSDGGDKDLNRTVPWIWPAPEYGGKLVMSTWVNGSELRIYLQPSVQGGPWTLIYDQTLPAGAQAGSPEWFTYNGKSYMFMAVYVNGNTYPSEVWITNIDAANPIFRRVSDNTTTIARNDPEVFVTTQYGPLIYWNEYLATLKPGHPLCGPCSIGVYRSDPGLLGL